MDRVPAVYITASQKRGTLYIGVTSDPIARLFQHRTDAMPGFTKRYSVKRLVCIEFFGDMESAILREKQLKCWHRAWKINLIEATNPGWRDLALDYGLEPLSRREDRAWMLKQVQHDDITKRAATPPDVAALCYTGTLW